MAWRLAKSLEVLRAEVLDLHPGTTFWTIGDAAHRASWSDHNPNASGVVCAADVLGDKGLNLAEFAERVRTSGHPALKYVIYNRRISHNGGAWQRYYGSNPHTSHAHVSVGIGPDGRSTGPYDNTTPWGIQEEDDMDLNDRTALPGFAREYWPGIGDGRNTVAVETALSGGYAYGRLVYEQQRDYSRQILAGQAALMAAVGGSNLGEIQARVRSELDRAAENERTERRAEMAGVLDEIREIADGGATADEIVSKLAERLAG